MLPEREQVLQIARLAGYEAFVARFGAPQTAQPDAEALRALVDERLDAVADGLVAEAAASDDVIDQTSATSYLEDRLRTLSPLLTPAQSDAIRLAFREKTAEW